MNFFHELPCLEVTYKKSTTVPGILDIRIYTRDFFVAAKISKNWPYKVFDEWINSCFSESISLCDVRRFPDWVCVCVCVYGLAICCWCAKRQGWPGPSLRKPLHPQVGWQATLMTLNGTQTLIASRMTELDSRGASERDLVLLLGNSGKLDLEKDRDDGGIALEKGDDQTVGEHWERHLFCW